MRQKHAGHHRMTPSLRSVVRLFLILEAVYIAAPLVAKGKVRHDSCHGRDRRAMHSLRSCATIPGLVSQRHHKPKGTETHIKGVRPLHHPFR